MQKTFEVINHTADTGIIAYGTDMKEAFVNAAVALFSIIVDSDTVREDLYRDVEVSADDQESLLVQWLNELIYIFDAEQIVLSRFEISQLTKTQLKATCFGEKVEPSRHKLKTGVKAATYHLLKVEKNNGYKIHVILDI